MVTRRAVIPDDVQAEAAARHAELLMLLDVAPCESCRRVPGDVPVIVMGVLFAVCTDCAAL